MDVEDYIDILRRYRSWIIGPAVAGLVIAIVVAFLWPDTYISTATLRITPQQISPNLLPSVISSQMADRVLQMQQEILSRSSLQELIQRPALDLFKSERKRRPMEDLIDEIRNQRIHIQVLADSGAVGERRYASAFSISFSYPDPRKARAMVQELVTKFTEQNVTVQKTQANLTTSFLGDELKSAKQRMDDRENEITQFKAANRGRLPEEFQANVQSLNNLQLQLSSLNDGVARAQQQKLLLEAQMQSLKQSESFANANADQSSGSQTVRNERLINLEKTITDGKSNLAALLQTYEDGYPEIQQIRARIAQLEREHAELEKQERSAAAAATTPSRTASPQAMKQIEDIHASQRQIQALLAAQQLEIESKTRAQGEITRRIASYQERIEGSSANEQRYAALNRDYTLAQEQYQNQKRRQEAAETAQNMQEFKAGENLEVLEPASLPEKPSDPNRYLISGIGLALGTGLGLLLCAAKEMKDTSLKNLKDVRAYTNLPVLSSIPLLENALLVRRKRRLVWLAWSGAVMMSTLAVAVAMYYHYFNRS